MGSIAVDEQASVRTVRREARADVGLARNMLEVRIHQAVPIEPFETPQIVVVGVNRMHLVQFLHGLRVLAVLDGVGDAIDAQVIQTTDSILGSLPFFLGRLLLLDCRLVCPLRLLLSLGLSVPGIFFSLLCLLLQLLRDNLLLPIFIRPILKLKRVSRDCGSGAQKGENRDRNQSRRRGFAPRPFPNPFKPGDRTGLDWLADQETVQVIGQSRGTDITPIRFLLQTFETDGFQIARRSCGCRRRGGTGSFSIT